MKRNFQNTCESVKTLSVIFLQLSTLMLIITSFAINDWVQGENWSGNLFYCTSGEYEGENYFSIYCSSADCIFNQLGKAGIVYTIFSVFSSILLVIWTGVSLHQLKTKAKTDQFLKILLSVGSTSCFYVGAVSWAGIAGFLNFGEQEQKCQSGPIVVFVCACLYSVVVAWYFWVFRDTEEGLVTQVEESAKELYPVPDMKSVRVEARFEYPNSIEHEHEGDI